MINETIMALANATMNANVNNSVMAAIPIKLVAETSPYQYWISIVISSIFTIYMFYAIFKTQIYTFSLKTSLKKFNKLTGRPTMIINHANEGLFSADMITRRLIPALNRAFQKMRGRDFNLILQSPGGDLFAAMLISKIFRNYSGRIHAYVPNYAMSGGTLLTLSCPEIHMNKYSSLGPLDVQIGSLFTSGSASGWKDVVRIKGKKADDQSIIFNRVGKQVEKSMKNYLNEIMKGKCNGKFVNFITEGSVEHIYQLDRDRLDKFGIKTTLINEMEENLLTKILRHKIKPDIELVMRDEV